jgi:transposase
MLRVAQAQSIKELKHHQGWSDRKIAEVLKLDVKTVRRVLSGEWDGRYTLSSTRRQPVGEAIEGRIREWLTAEKRRNAPRKQRLRSSRMAWLLREEGLVASEATVRRVARRVRAELSDPLEWAAVPLEFDPGKDGQVDFCESVVDTIDGERKAYHLVVRACYSKRAFVIDVPSTNQEALFEGLIASFDHFGGVFKRLWFDNLTPAVRQVLKGRDRLLQERFKHFQAHYGFGSEFCAPAKGNEKGAVERTVPEFRTHVMAPVPFDAGDGQLADAIQRWMAQEDATAVLADGTTAADLWVHEVEHLIPLPRVHFDVARQTTRKVSAYSWVQYATNSYSVPTRYLRWVVTLKVFAARIEVHCREGLIATHPRLSGKGRVSLKLEHYLDLLERKPRAFDHAAPVRAARAHWPANYSALLQVLREREGEAEGTRAFILVLRQHEHHPASRVHQAVTETLAHASPSIGLFMEILDRKFRAAQPTVSLPPAVTVRWPRLNVHSTSPADYSRLLTGGERL